MENLITERFERLESALKAIQGETVPIPGHTDPGALQDCWITVHEYTGAIKSKIRQMVFETWITAMRKSKGENVSNYDELIKKFGIQDMVYLPGENDPKRWNELNTEMKHP